MEEDAALLTPVTFVIVVVTLLQHWRESGLKAAGELLLPERIMCPELTGSPVRGWSQVVERVLSLEAGEEEEKTPVSCTGEIKPWRL